jgi:hypothetical protein
MEFGPGGIVKRLGLWFGAAVLPLVIWPALDWSQAIAMAVTDYWFARTGHMPSWEVTGTIQIAFAVVCGIASGLLLYVALRVLRRADSTERIGWLAMAVSLLIALWAARSVTGASGDPGYVTAVLARATPGLAMAVGAVTAQVRRSKPAASVQPDAA